MTTISETNLPYMLYKGKVRDTYDMGDNQLLMVATDGRSAFDVVLPTGIPEKGAVLCQRSAFWFKATIPVFFSNAGSWRAGGRGWLTAVGEQ